MIQPVPLPKILLLVCYCDRPILVRNALRSVEKAAQRYDKWVMAFGDDGSKIPGEPIVRELLAPYISRIGFYNTHATIEDKIANGITIGKLANEVLAYTDADVCITLCDDDELHPDYLYHLARYFAQHKTMYCWSNIHLYNPFLEDSRGVHNLGGIYNESQGPMNPYGHLDGSQVAFRVSAIRDHNIWYRDTTKSSREDQAHKPWSYNLDGELFKQFYQKFGPCPYTGFVSQYKGVHDRQLVYHKEHIFKDQEDILKFHKDVIHRAGKDF